MALTVGELMLADSYERDMAKLRSDHTDQVLALTEKLAAALHDKDRLLQACRIMLVLLPIVPESDPRHKAVAPIISLLKAMEADHA